MKVVYFIGCDSGTTTSLDVLVVNDFSGVPAMVIVLVSRRRQDKGRGGREDEEALPCSCS